MKYLKYILLIHLALVQLACREKFAPPEVVSPDPVLIVEGVLVAGPETTSIRLSRSARLDNSTSVTPEDGAFVTVEGKDNSVQPLNGSPNGFYTYQGLNMTVGQEYRLRIVTANGHEYASEFLTVRTTPAIDSVGFRQNEDGVRIHVSTHDDTNETRYYLWNYDETWEINSAFYSTLAYRGQSSVTPRMMPQEEVFRCWKYDGSSAILINSSEKLAKDIIFEAPLEFFQRGDERLGVRYSMFLRQYAIDKAAYEFYELMKKNTESLGTVFDPQPTEVSGNIRGITDPSELVIGYVTASTVSTTRYFLRNSQLRNFNLPASCFTEQVRNHPDSIRDAFAGGGLMPYDALFSAMGGSVDTTYFLSAAPDCVDCRQRGGDLQKPSYW